MAEFVKEYDLNAALAKIFKDAENQLIIISPFIKLHSRLIDILKSKRDEYKLKITVVFGKNEDNISKSLSKDKFEFLKDFPDIEIRYEPRLHAKYYANEFSALLSSMNLYDYSQDKNIEFGILTKTSLVGELTRNLLGDSIDKEAFKYFVSVIENSKILYKKTPCYEDKMMGLSKKYTHSDIEINELSELYGSKVTASKTSKDMQEQNDNNIGFCIRTGEKIPFNPERPLSNAAYKSWSKYKDKEFKEKYCHYSGEPSKGETSFAKPILRKNWKKSKIK